ncbi:MAG: methyltransferase domain-containing protein [Bacteroidetes bacterium]|nr:MAG: methyltransferase domain-containing protein [Bacteroidota bacterium]
MIRKNIAEVFLNDTKKIIGEIKMYDFTIEQASKNANVSTATIRNWIKTGYLEVSSKGIITQKSFDDFMLNIAGKEKLNSRANKSLKNVDIPKKTTDEIKALMQNCNDENIGIEYENSLSNAYRNKEGIYYTPSWVVKDMFKNIKFDHHYKFLDPCCGSGNFIIEAIKAGILPENIYGFDVDENAIFITKERIKQTFGFETPNIKVGNFLEEASKLSKENLVFDLIFTNPPWGKKIDKEVKEKLASIYDTGNSLDTTALFMGASMFLLKKNGLLGFLVQEAFFNITTFEDIRKKMIAKKMVRFVDYGKVFKGLMTKAQAIIIKNISTNADDVIECCVENKNFERKLISFKKNPKFIFNFWANENETQVIEKLYATKHITLKNKATWALGIVTGNNDRFCSNTQKDGYIPIYKGADITKNGLKKPTTFIANDFSSFQQVAPLKIYQAKEKLVYKFISSNLCFFCDTEQNFVLNSANLLIPFDIGITNQQLTDLLNSEIINWLFNKLFSTHKVLRSDLELLPIHIDYFSYYHEFSETNYLNYLQITKTKNGTFTKNCTNGL